MIVALGIAAALAWTAPAVSVEADTPSIDELWIAPADLERRDLFRGPEGPPAPVPNPAFAFVARDTSGRSPGFDVRDARGVNWSVKLGVEAQSEVAVSRLLWAIGYHQPATYYVDRWTMTGVEAGPQPGGRFRPEPRGQQVAGDWKWDDNPFIGMRPFAGLLVAQMIINNWDLKSSNNKVYEPSAAGGRRQYIVRDLGASLGFNKQSHWTRWLGIRAAQGSKNDLEGFEKVGFIDEVEGGRVVFAYRGPNAGYLEKITPADVTWTCSLLSRLSDDQWQDAFRAAGYPLDVRNRYIVKLKEKIAQSLALD